VSPETVSHSLPPNIVLDAKTVEAMVRIYCRDKHGGSARDDKGCDDLRRSAHALAASGARGQAPVARP
jgi:hypothetical protein